MHTTFLSLGSNLGNTYENLNNAVQLLFEHVGIISKISPVYKSNAHGFEGPDFLNCVLLVKTQYHAQEVLTKIHAIEVKLGRQRSGNGYTSRPIDIDILLYDNETIDTDTLIIPHPEIQLRDFVLQPLKDIAGETIHPIFRKTITQLMEECECKSQLEKQPKWLKYPKDEITLGHHNYIAIEGNIGAGKTSLAQMISEEFNAKLILERFKDNPFLPKFYQEPDRYAFPLEMSFLADRYQQLMDDISQYDLFSDFMVSDYDRYKSLIFAQVTLQEEEFVLYKRLHEMMYREMPKPDLYVYLYQNTDRLMENIKKRGRSYEQDISSDYLDKINKGYLEFIKSQHQLSVKIIDVSALDFVNNRTDFLEVVRQF